MKLVEQLADVLFELKDRLGGRIEIGATPFRERLDARSCLQLILLSWFNLFYIFIKKPPSVVGVLRQRAVIVTFETKGLLSVDLVCSGTPGFEISPDLEVVGRAPKDALESEPAAACLARLIPIRRLVFSGRLDALERLASLLEPPPHAV